MKNVDFDLKTLDDLQARQLNEFLDQRKLHFGTAHSELAAIELIQKLTQRQLNSS